MKKLTAFLLSMTCSFTLAACSNTQAPSENTESDPQENETVTAEPETPEEESQPTVEEEDGQILVVYYSNTGNTEAIANYLVELTDADLFELEPVEPYTDEDLDWTDENSRVVYEHDNPEAQNVELVNTDPENWDSYDTVFIGYPIWWGNAAWPVNDFVASNDFTDKTVIPFATSSSSGFGESGQLLAEMAGSGEWLEGRRFSSSASQEDVADWLAELGL